MKISSNFSNQSSGNTIQHIYWTLLTGSYEVQLSVYLPVSEEFFLVTVYEFFLGFST